MTPPQPHPVLPLAPFYREGWKKSKQSPCAVSLCICPRTLGRSPSGDLLGRLQPLFLPSSLFPSLRMAWTTVEQAGCGVKTCLESQRVNHGALAKGTGGWVHVRSANPSYSCSVPLPSVAPGREGEGQGQGCLEAASHEGQYPCFPEPSHPQHSSQGVCWKAQQMGHSEPWLAKLTLG